MKHYLECHYVLSGELPQEAVDTLRDFFEKFVSKVNEDRKEGNFEIKEWKLDGTQLFLVIDSDESLAPHVAILRMRKQLAKIIGKQYKTGLRGFKFHKYIIDTPLEKAPQQPFKLPLTKSIEFYEENGVHRAKITIDPEIAEDFVEKGTIERIIRRVNEKIDKQYYGAKKEHHEIVWYTGEKKMYSSANPTKELQKANWIQRTNYRNQWILSPSITSLVEAIKKIMVEHVYKPLGYHQMMIPKLVDWSIWLRSQHAEG
ncbi:MAG: hypothetical protein ACTSYD_11090, partial [Candidatus Heimdallarchaeaceae archaeon]